MITIVPISKKNRERIRVRLYACSPISMYVNNSEIREYIEGGEQVDFNFNTIQGKYKDQVEFSPRDCLLGIIKTAEEKTSQDDVKLLNNIIRNGGFVNYIKKMEGVQ